MGNEADLAALAEHRAGRRATTSSTSRAGSASAPGSCWAAAVPRVGGRAGELGHVVVDPAGPGTCGGRGCLEREAGLEALCRAAGVGDLDALAAAARREPAADAALRAGGHALGVALAGAVNLLDVPTVVLGGGYPRLGPVLRDAVADELARRVEALPGRGAGVRAGGRGGAARGGHDGGPRRARRVTCSTGAGQVLSDLGGMTEVVTLPDSLKPLT